MVTNCSGQHSSLRIISILVVYNCELMKQLMRGGGKRTFSYAPDVNVRCELTDNAHWPQEIPRWTFIWVAVISAKNHKRQRRKRQSVTAKREKSQTPKFLTATLTLPNLI